MVALLTFLNAYALPHSTTIIRSQRRLYMRCLRFASNSNISWALIIGSRLNCASMMLSRPGDLNTFNDFNTTFL